MPTYQITDTQTGKVFKVSGTSPPSEQEASQIFADYYKANGGETAAGTVQGNINASPAEIDAMRRKFISDTGTATEKLKQMGRDVSPYVRPVLEAGGAIGGGLLGAAGGTAAGLGVGSIPGAMTGGVVGSGLGFAAGKNIADTLDEAVGLKDGGSMGDRFANMARDIATGATYEMGGQVAGKLVGAGAGKVIDKWKGRNSITPAATTAERKASEIIQETTAAPTVGNASAKQLESNALMQRIKSEVDPTLGQATGSIEQNLLEQSLAAKNPKLAADMFQNDAKLNQAAVNNLTNTLGTSPELPAVQSAQQTGDSILKAVQNALTPVKKAESKIWGAIPDYQLPTNGTQAAFNGALEMPSTSQDLIRNLKSVFDKTPKTVKGLQMIEREINSAIKAGTDTDRHFLSQIKSAIKTDFDTFGKAVDAGDVALYEGQLVRPSELQQEIATLQQSLENAKGADLSLPEQNQSLFKYLADKGEVVLQNTGVSDAQYAKALESRLDFLKNKKGIGFDYAPPASAANQQIIDNLTNGINSKLNILNNLQPADDVGKAYQRAKAFSKQQHFDRFGKGEIKNILQMGDQLNSTRVPSEQIPTRLFTASGIDGLVKAIGQPKAQAQMMPYIMDVINANTVSNTGVMQIPRAMAIIRQMNREGLLNKLGATNQVKQIVKDQIPAAIRSHLETLPQDILGNPIQTARQASKMLRDFGPAVKELYGADSSVLNAMRDYHRTLEMLGRNKNVSYSKGSATVEKLFADAPAGSLARRIFDAVAGTVAGGTAGAMVGGPVGGAVGAITGKAGQAVYKTISNYNKEQVIKVLEDAIMNPETAHTIMSIARTGKADRKAINNIISSMGAFGTKEITSANEAQP